MGVARDVHCRCIYIRLLIADEWKNWTCIYSPFALWDVLPSEHMECWLNFVHACRIICQPILQNDEISKIHELLIEFCKTCEILHDTEFCTMNLHFHCHMSECLYDFDPLHGFWCFAFERCNVILGSYPNNNRNIEKTIMTCLIEESSRSAHHKLSDMVELVYDLFIDGSHGSVSETQMNPEDFLTIRNLSKYYRLLDAMKIDYSLSIPLSPFSETGLSDSFVDAYRIIHQSDPPKYVGNLCKRLTWLKVRNHIILLKISL